MTTAGLTAWMGQVPRQWKTKLLTASVSSLLVKSPCRSRTLQGRSFAVAGEGPRVPASLCRFGERDNPEAAMMARPRTLCGVV